MRLFYALISMNYMQILTKITFLTSWVIFSNLHYYAQFFARWIHYLSHLIIILQFKCNRHWILPIFKYAAYSHLLCNEYELIADASKTQCQDKFLSKCLKLECFRVGRRQRRILMIDSSHKKFLNGILQKMVIS